MALADSIAEAHPDSAYNLLMQVNESDLDDAGRAVYNLVLNQAKYKLYRPASANSLTRSVDYFRQHQDLQHLQRAYYYRAAINEEEKGSMEQSLVDYKAAESMVTPSTDLMFQARIYDKLVAINLNSWNDEEALKWARKEYTIAQRLGDMAVSMNALNDMINTFRNIGQPDSAYFYIQRSLQMLPQCPDSLKAGVYNNYAVYLEENTGNLTEAKKYYEKSLSLDKQANVLISLAQVNMQLGKEKEAFKILEEFKNDQDVEISISAYVLLEDYYVSQNDYRNAYLAKTKSDSLTYSMDLLDNKRAIEEIQKKYDNNILKAAKEKEKFRILLTSISVIIVLTGICILIYLFARKRGRQIERMKHQLSVLNDSLHRIEEDRKKSIAEKAREYSALIKKKETVILRLEKELANTEKQDKEKTSEYKRLVSTMAIFFYVMQNEAAILNDKQNRTDFIDCYRKLDETFVRILEKISAPAVTTQEKLLAILLRIEKTPEEIRSILGLSNDAYRQLKSRMLKKLKTEPSMERFCDKIR